MWAAEVQAAGLPTWWQIVGPLVAALIGVSAGVYGTRSSLRASEATNRTALARLDHDRDSAIDARTDKQLEQVWAQLTAARADAERRTQQFWELTERHQRLRLAVLALGHDPEALIGPTLNGRPGV